MSPTIFDAIDFAVQAHRGKFRKGTRLPYILHPLGVARILIGYGCPDTVVIAGILHDTVEDTPATLEEIEASFGEEVARIVAAVSEPDKSASWESRKEHTIASLKTAPAEVLLVTLADKLDNLRAIREDHARLGDALWSRFKRPQEQQRWYYQSIADAIASRTLDEPLVSLLKEYQAELKMIFED